MSSYTNYVLLQVVVCLLLKTSLFAQWDSQDSGINEDLVDICFVDSVHGWAIGENVVISTVDGGEQWNTQETPIVNSKFRKLQFVNEDVGYIIGDNGLIMRSDNGGENWQPSNYETDYTYTGLSFIDELNGWISGFQETDTLPVGVIIHTDDGGYTWDKQLELFYEIGVGSTSFWGIEFSNSNEGFTYGFHNLDPLVPTRIYSTTNGGDTWYIKGNWESWVVKEIKLASGDSLWGTRPFITSFDGGVNWKYHESEFNDWIRTISPINGMEGWGYYNNFNTNVKAILYTSNGGFSWLEDLMLGDSYVEAMYQISGKYLWIVGENGMIKKRTEITTDIETHNYREDYFGLDQNYPNPFNSKTTISYNIAKESNIQILIYDVLGNEIEELVNEHQMVGLHEICFESENLSSGIYYYKIVADNFIKLKKMILLK